MKHTRRQRTAALAAGLALLLPTAAGGPATAAERGAPPAPEPAAATTTADEEYAGYLFSYFVGEGTADGEQVYFGLSAGDDPLNYRDLNDGEPVLTSTMGDEGVRDPFIIRAPEGDKFYQIATDLKVHGSWDWDGFQRHGSRSIMVWESTDLVNWTDQRLVEVAPESAGNVWAPEAFYDEELGEYVVFWASKLYDEDDPEHAGAQHNRMMYATTSDFVEFSEPQVWIDPGYSVIDSTVIREGDKYYRFTKDERNNTSTTPCSKFITAEVSTQLRSTDYDFIADCIGKAADGKEGIAQGEGPLVFKDNHDERWYMFIDEFGGRGYVPFVSDDLDSGEWTVAEDYTMPSHPRHGTVLPVTRAEYERLLAAYQPDALATELEPVAVTTRKKHAPLLPQTVEATFADGSTGTAPVEWDEIDEADYARSGEFEVRGVVADASEPALARVTVQNRPIAATGIEIQDDDGALALWRESSAELSAAVEPANASGRLVWTSSDETVATVEDGLVSAVEPGTTTITARIGRHHSRVEVTVTEQPPGLRAHYPLTGDGRSAVDGVDDAVLAGGAVARADGVELDGVDDHVALPADLMAGLEDITVSLEVKIDPGQQGAYFIYGLGNSRDGAGDGYLFTTGNAYRTSISTGNWSGERTVSAGADLERGSWKTLTYTLADETAVLYLDGVEVGRADGVDVDPGAIGDGKTSANYIGRSLYDADRHLWGEVRDFRIYDRALGAEEVAGLQ
ncbi:LamG-like jellyroll fold domain-containing protein [Zhihengliuella halotolerans]|uniref:Glycosyl hydrolase family 43 n=1 Tax=Zhihengliuella halotolerans TaxID=370736 RepID=A0A4Q8AA98_9MICC|nr:LamG-like jellyroll fold domain-containing protein [Zhihengliuella halotolerans]RZU60884.1 glycosyl hydrolase family 43 [Zhihengliuella halotolerans]